MWRTKLSMVKAAQVYAEVPNVLRALAAERDWLREKLAAAERELASYKIDDRIKKIAHKMEEKHIGAGLSFEDRVSRIKQAAAGGKSLDAIEEAIDMVAPWGELGRLDSGPGEGNSDTSLVSFLLGGLE
jgi:hypothetical protein